MGEETAIRLALDLMHMPSRVWQGRAGRLPDGMELLLRVAAGDQEAVDHAAGLTARTGATLHAAAAFFVEQILLADDADSYRVLGAGPESSPAELRRNMALLVRHFHPDVAPAFDVSVFTGRITRAWDDVKTPERRAEYDRRLARDGAPRSPGHHLVFRPTVPRYNAPVGQGVRSGSRIDGGSGARPSGWLGRILVLLLPRRARH